MNFVLSASESGAEPACSAASSCPSALIAYSKYALTTAASSAEPYLVQPIIDELFAGLDPAIKRAVVFDRAADFFGIKAPAAQPAAAGVSSAG